MLFYFKEAKLIRERVPLQGLSYYSLSLEEKWNCEKRQLRTGRKMAHFSALSSKWEVKNQPFFQEHRQRNIISGGNNYLSLYGTSSFLSFSVYTGFMV
jgi:hypothetical protein